ncbi:MAG: hypothetical protein ABIG84_04320 [archaeon]
MDLFQRLRNLSVGETSYKHRKKDNVHLFGGVAGIVSIISGIVMYVMVSPLAVAEHIKVLGLVWVVFGLLAFYALYVFEYVDRRRGGRILAALGVIGMLVGVGFFLGALMMAFSGILAIRYSVRRIGQKMF